MLALAFYRRGITVEETDAAPFRSALAHAIRTHADGPRVLIHRDYFAGNLLLLPERQGVARVGVIDFQLGQMGQPVYDLVSLLQDARRDVSRSVEAAMIARFAEARGLGDIGAAYAVWGVQRSLRILGIFARLCLVEGKSGYLTHLPRVMRDLRRNLTHPVLVEVKRFCDGLLPDPTPENIAKLEAQCGSFR